MRTSYKRNSRNCTTLTIEIAFPLCYSKGTKGDANVHGETRGAASAPAAGVIHPRSFFRLYIVSAVDMKKWYGSIFTGSQLPILQKER